MEESGSVQLITDPVGPKTYGNHGPDPEHCQIVRQAPGEKAGPRDGEAKILLDLLVHRLITLIHEHF
jgi:hypothetical protein